MYDIITFGSATWDIFIKPKNFQKVSDKNKFITGEGVCFGLGSKVEVKDIFFSSGGGGTNTAATFAKQGFKVAYCGKVGEDLAGKEVIKELDRFNVDTEFVFRTKEKPTNLSIILSAADNNRTIFVYRGASEELKKNEIPLKNLKAKWFYLAPLSDKLCGIFEDLVDFAHKNKIKIVVNPGNSQLSLPEATLKKILKKINILILNQEEASFLTKIPYQKEAEIFKKIDEICPGIAIVTKGERGALVSDGKYLYKCKTPKIKVVDSTGAGDSFASGFVSGYILKNGDIEYALRLGTANATACLKKIGAKNGLLKKSDKWEKVEVEKKIIS